MLADLLDEDDGTRRDRWPFLLPVLRRIVDLRNQLSHGWASGGDEQVQIVTWNRGRTHRYTYRTGELEWLAWQAHVARLELVQLWAAVVPGNQRWHR